MSDKEHKEWLNKEIGNKKKRKKKDDSSDSSEDFQSSSGESDLSQSSSGDEESFGEDLIKDETDEIYLNSLSEKERESILAERYEQKKRSDSRRKILKKRQTSSEKRTTEVALSELKAKIEQKRKKERMASSRKESNSPTNNKEYKKRKSDDDNENDDDDEESNEDSNDEKERDRKRRRTNDNNNNKKKNSNDDDNKKSKKKTDDDKNNVSQLKIEEIPSLAELNSIRLTRDNLEKWVEEPYFSTLVPGFFVRIGLGLNRKGSRVYRVAQIKGVQDGSSYYIINNTKTNLLLNLQHGKNEKTFRMEFASNQDFSISEYNKWLQTMKEDKCSIIPKSEIETHLKRLSDVKNFVYTFEAVKGMIQKKKKINKPVNIAREKAVLLAKKGELADNDPAREKLDKKLKKLEELAKLEELDTSDKKIKVADINRKNKETNIILTSKTGNREGDGLKSTMPGDWEKNQKLLESENNNSSIDEEDKAKNRMEFLKSSHIEWEAGNNNDNNNNNNSEAAKKQNNNKTTADNGDANVNAKFLSVSDYKRRRGI